MASSSTKMEIIPGKDRFLSATRPIQPGEILLTDQPLILYPASLSYLEIFCSNCFRIVSSEQFRCMTCNIARFCSARCYSSSHPTLLCHALPSLIADELQLPSHTPDLIFLLSIYSTSADSILQLISLPSPDSPPYSLIEYLETQFVRLIPRNMIPRHFSHGITFKLLSVEKTYGLPIYGPRESDFIDCDIHDIRAYGLFFRASHIKHSCLPNSCVFNDVDDPNRQGDTTFVFKALDWIGEGKEISRSFVDDHLDMEYDDRFRMIKGLKGFDCKCHRCDTEKIFEKNKLDKGKRQPIAPYAHFIDCHVCHHCQGCLAPLPPSQDGVVSTVMQCNKCGVQVTKNQPDPPAAEDASSRTV
ncbi:histone-lysine N-methyltransferase ASHR2-like [Carex rostrata]